jgi:hypothetical protein
MLDENQRADESLTKQLDPMTEESNDSSYLAYSYQTQMRYHLSHGKAMTQSNK